MEITIVHNSMVIDRISTKELVTESVFGEGAIASTCRLRLDRLDRGLWMEVFYHDTTNPIIDDLVQVGNTAERPSYLNDDPLNPWKIADPRRAQKIWLLDEDEIEDVREIWVDRTLVVKRFGEGHFIDMMQYGAACAKFRENSDAFDIYIEFAANMQLDPDNPATVGKVAPLLGWHEDDLSAVIAFQMERMRRETMEEDAFDGFVAAR